MAQILAERPTWRRVGKPLPASRLAVLPATSHTVVITQPELLHASIEPFLKGETPKGMFEAR